MNVVVFGASGMVGQGVLRECLLDADVARVVSVVRRPTGERHAKLHEVVHGDFRDFTSIEPELTGFDACFFCLGISSVGLSEQRYREITYDIALAAATTLARLNPAMTFVYVSGASTDSTEQGRVMWARVKGETENAVLRLPFRAAYMFRPGAIQPMHGVRSKTWWYQAIYSVTRPLLPFLLARFPKYVTTSEQIGRAMLRVARNGYPKPILENLDINAV